MISRFRGLIGSIDNNIFSSKDILWQYAANFGAPVLGAIFILLLGRFLEIENFGIYAIVAATPVVVNAVFDFRLQEVSIVLLNKRTDEETKQKDLSCLFMLDIAVRIIAFILSSAAGYAIFHIYDINISPEIAIVSAAGFLFWKGGSATALGVLRQSGNIRIYAILQSCDWMTRVLLLLLCQATGTLSIETVFYLQLAPALLFNIVTIYRSIRVSRRTLGLGMARLSDVRLIGFFRTNRRVLFSSQAISSSEVVARELDTLICGALLPPHSVAIYKMAKNFAYMAWKLVDPLFIVLLPGVARYIAEGRITELAEFIKRAMGRLLLVSVTLYLVSCAGAWAVTEIALGEEYRQVAMVYPLIALWIIVSLPLIWTHSVAIASGNAPVQAWAGAIGNLFGLVVLTAGAAVLGIYGASIGLSIAFAAPFALSFYLLIRKKIIQW